jgi:methyl-CpG-binding domain protein 4
MKRKIIRPLLQEIYKDDPWKMLVCCILLNLTHRRQVDTIREELFDRYPSPLHMAFANESELSHKLKPLGFYNKRAKTLKRMSLEYVRGFKKPKELHGIGKYGSDSWEIFQNENFNISPEDEVLKEYLNIIGERK